jgi:tRNA-Thr(GGU) m(6)t(6)A37 methyltransferase TsaA
LTLGRRVALREVRTRPIGIVHTEASQDEIRERREGILSQIEIFPQFEKALDGLEGFSHIFVIGYLNQLRPEQIGRLKVQPRGLLKYGLKLEELPLVGVFALDSPTRPNPIGLSLVPLMRRERRTLHVSDLDYFDETPVLDIKPYQSSYKTEDYRVPDWHERLRKKAGRV